jgi:hypothetical protein
MALIRFAEGQQRSGHIGATVYSHNRFGQYVRARSIPVNPLTDRQNAVRILMAQLASNWNNLLTQGQRNLWNTYGAQVKVKNRLGDDVYLTGLNQYVRSNVALLQAGLTRVDDAPTIYTLPDPESALVVTASEALQQLAIAFNDAADWCTEAGGAELVSMGSPQNAGIGFFGGPWRFVDAIEGVAPGGVASPQSLAVPFAFVEGQRIWVRTRIVRADGRLSNFAQTNFLGAA